jgi:hypothetical protein
MFQSSNATRRGRDAGAAADSVGEVLERELADLAIVLHDLRVPGSRASVDHVVIAASGVWVVDSRRRDVGWELESRENATAVDEAGRHVDVVANAVGGRVDELPIWSVLCFDREYWGGTEPHAFWMDGVLVTHPADLVERVLAAGPLDEDTIGLVAARLALE